MTGPSLGLRSGSYGSLQQHLYNGSQLSAAAPTNSSPSLIRKNSKMLLPGLREKERRLPWICKLASRRKVGMLLLLVASIAIVFSFFFAVTKDEEPQAGLETVIDSSDSIWNSLSYDIQSDSLSPPSIHLTEVQENTIPKFDTQIAHVINETHLLPESVKLMTIPSRHPCENFSLPPPPVDPKRTGPRPCDVCYVPVELAMAYMPALPSVSPILKNLNYVSEENLITNESDEGSFFGGHPSLQQRDESFDIKESMTVHCGFVKGKKPGQVTGFDIDDADLLEMEQCRGVVVASAIFGNYDVMQQPRNIGEDSKRTACFYMFVDEETEASIKNSSILDSKQKVGLWRVVVVRNLPYSDARRNGKIPKLLLHRIFPNARFSLWIDGKLELVVDPYQILERFLWRNNVNFAISRHYKRFDVFEEAEANKIAGKYENASIDHQIEFYKGEGLTRFSPAKYPITSDVPEGCVIIREHTPITNLFTCLWFNEVDRFTSRDQLSFSTVRDKIMSKLNWSINMFLDCERRNFVVQAYHRDILEQMLATQPHHPPRILPGDFPDAVPDEAETKSTPNLTAKKMPMKRAKDKKPSSKKHRPKGAAVARDPSLF